MKFIYFSIASVREQYESHSESGPFSERESEGKDSDTLALGWRKEEGSQTLQQPKGRRKWAEPWGGVNRGGTGRSLQKENGWPDSAWEHGEIQVEEGDPTY